MRLGFICVDTRGGIQPYVALARKFVLNGHDVTIFAPEYFQSFISAQRLNVVALKGDPRELLMDTKNAGVTERGFLAAHTLVVDLMRKRIPEWAETILANGSGFDALIGSVFGSLIGPTLGEKLGIPFIQAHVQPWSPTTELPGLFGAAMMSSAPGWIRRLSFEATRQIFWLPMRSAVIGLRRQLSLPPNPGPNALGRCQRGQPLLYGFSEILVPRPKDWPAEATMTGYWFLDLASDWTPSEELLRFLDEGDPPVCIGFGSMTSGDAGETTKLVLEAVQSARVRAVLLAGWGGLKTEAMPDGVFALDSAPHDWLLPRCSVSVHHGGSGTTGASLRAGIPSVIVPFTADQPFWAHCVQKKGLGLAAPQRKKLNSTNLANCIRSVLGNESIKSQAHLAGLEIQREDGLEKAVRKIEKFLDT